LRHARGTGGGLKVIRKRKQNGEGDKKHVEKRFDLAFCRRIEFKKERKCLENVEGDRTSLKVRKGTTEKDL